MHHACSELEVFTGITPTNNIISNFWFGSWLDNKSSFRSFYVLIYCSKKRVSAVRKTKVMNHRRIASSPRCEIQISSEAVTVTNTAFVREGVIMIVAVWTHLKGVEWGSLWQKSEVWTPSKRKITQNSLIKQLLMLIKTFRTLVNPYNCSFFLNSNSARLNPTYTSHLIFFGIIIVPKALFASLSHWRNEYKRKHVVCKSKGTKKVWFHTFLRLGDSVNVYK